jgi:hypothetical protein
MAVKQQRKLAKVFGSDASEVLSDQTTAAHV